MKKISAVALSLALGFISMALTPNFTFAHRADTGKELAAVRVPANQSRHIEFSVSPQGEVTAANGADHYTLDVTNSSPGPTAPDSGYLNGTCYGVIKKYDSGVMIWQLNLTTRFQYDGFQSVRRVSLTSAAVGYAGWSTDSHSSGWGPGGNSWLSPYTDATFSHNTNFWQGSVDEEADSEGGCRVYTQAYFN